MLAFRRSLIRHILSISVLSVGVFLNSPAPAQHSPARTTGVAARTASNRPFPALFISDIHFDPLHDPGKAKQLSAAPASEWKSIMASAGSPHQQQAFAALQKQCGATGVDTPFTLLQSSLKAMKRWQSDAKFILLSGDLVVHGFECRYSALFPDAMPQDYQAFVLKTMSYVIGELRVQFPGIPIYTALGNNDSGCADYRLDADGDFLAKAAEIVASGLPAAQRAAVSREFSAEGNYSVSMPAPMKDTRLLVLNDIFLSSNYRTCGKERDSKGADEEIAWLNRQLAQARQLRQRVWVMGHIPPGIDPFSTAKQFKDVCNGESPVMFLSSDELPDLMVEYADVVKLGIFAHTHMDEVRLLQQQHPSNQQTHEQSVAVKMVPSISPVHGNLPSVTAATIDPVSAGIQDYTVIVSSNQTGNDAKWTPEYSFDRTYRQTDFSAKVLNMMIDKFRTDNVALLPESEKYLQNYYAGDRAAALSPFWRQYVCVLNNYTAKAYAACICRTGN